VGGEVKGWRGKRQMKGSGRMRKRDEERRMLPYVDPVSLNVEAHP
jgi:hypothetical protein